MHSEDVVFIGIPDLARKLHRTRQDVHHRARNGLLPITSYPLRRNRQLTYIFLETEVDEYVQQLAKTHTVQEEN